MLMLSIRGTPYIDTDHINTMYLDSWLDTYKHLIFSFHYYRPRWHDVVWSSIHIGGGALCQHRQSFYDLEPYAAGVLSNLCGSKLFLDSPNLQWEQGPELALDAPDGIKQLLFQKQSEKWEGFSREHMLQILRRVDDCLKLPFNKACS